MASPFSKKLIIKYLQFVKKNIDQNVKVALDAYHAHFQKTNEFIGWMVVRMLFPDIDYLGSLRFGTENSNQVRTNAIKYMKMYFSKADPAYNYGAGLVYYIYRHGLIHQQFPKHIRVRYKKLLLRSISLSISNEGRGKLTISKTEIRINATALFHHLLNSIDQYSEEVRIAKLSDAIFANYRKGYKFMMSPKSLKNLYKEKYLTKQDFKEIQTKMLKKT